jgi:hypothetical protein
MPRSRYEDVPVAKTDNGVDVSIPLPVANELGFMRLNKSPVEFGKGKNKVVLHIDDQREPLKA